MSTTAVLFSSTGGKEALPAERKEPLNCGGAKGTRTPNPLLAKQVRYQLRHGPRVLPQTWGSGSAGGVGRLRPEVLLGLLGLELALDRCGAHGGRDEDEELLHGRSPSLAGCCGEPGWWA